MVAQTIDTLEDELVQLRGLAREKDDLEVEAANLANACEGLSVQLDQTRTHLADMEHAKLVAEGKLADLVAELDALQRERRALASELDHQTVSRGDLLGKHKTLETRLTEVERLLSSAEADRNMLDEHIKSALADLDATQRRLAATEGDRDSLKVRVDSLQHSFNTEAAERKTACDKIADVEARLHECDAALEEAKVRADQANARADRAEHERDRMRLQHESAVNEFKLAAAANDKYCTERSDHERRIGDLLRELDRITVEFHRTERRLADCELENGALREDNEVGAVSVARLLRRRICAHSAVVVPMHTACGCCDGSLRRTRLLPLLGCSQQSVVAPCTCVDHTVCHVPGERCVGPSSAARWLSTGFGACSGLGGTAGRGGA